MRDPGPPLSQRRFLLYLAVAVVAAVLVIGLAVLLLHHGPVPK
jgi:hypothetical protein